MLMLGFVTLALCSIGILAAASSGEVAYLLCVLFSFAGAFIPVVMFDAAPRLSRRPELLGSTVGLATQGNNAGIVIGPAAAGTIAGDAGWGWVTVPIVAIATLAALAAYLFRQQLDAER